MTNYWVITPYHSNKPDDFEDAWNYDIKNNTIAIGWTELGDISKLSKKELREKFRDVYTNIKGKNWVKKNLTRDTNMIWNFYHEVKPGDIFLARRGRNELIGVGTVIGGAYYSEKEGAKRTPNTKSAYNNFIRVEWKPKTINYENIVFGISTLYPISQEKFNKFTQVEEEQDINDESIISPAKQEFALEKYLEHFIVKNFRTINVLDSLELWEDEEGNIGQQYSLLDDKGEEIGRIDLLAKNITNNSYVVIELKKGRSSDKVVGQTLRYMGWVQENLVEEDEKVEGMIICKEKDKKLEYALKQVDNINIKLYEIDFRLVDG